MASARVAWMRDAVSSRPTHERRAGAARRAAWLLRRRRDGDQGAGLDGPQLRPPVYCYHEIVHNQVVVERFEAQGVVFVDDIAEVPPGSPIMLSAHGSAPDVVAAAERARQLRRRLGVPAGHQGAPRGAVRAGKGYRIVYVGHEGHEEAVGTMAVAPDAITRVESVRRGRRAARVRQPVALLAQTTLSHRDWDGVAVAVRERFPDVWTPGRSDLCFATTNRQSALMALAGRCDAIVIIGSANSSNTVALEKLAREAGCPIVCTASTPPTSCRPTILGRRDRRRHRRGVGARRARRRRRRPPRPD